MINYVFPDKIHEIDITINSAILFGDNKRWHWESYLFLPCDIISKINNIPIPMTNIKDKIVWKFNSIGQFSIKSATWANNTDIPSYPKAKFISNLWILKLRSKWQLFAWKLVRDILPTRSKLRNRGMSILTECPICGQEEETY